MRVVDLRSDTVTRPTPAMRQAMARAEVGDDVYEDDPTVNQLQERCAGLTGKQAALFMPSGTMSNAVALKAHTQPGDEVLMDTHAHSMLYEVGMPATIAHVLTRQFRSNNGIPDAKTVFEDVHAASLHHPGTTLLVLENTHNRAGGYVTPLEIHRILQAGAKAHRMRVHLDGARIFNAVVATKTPLADFAETVDSLTFCLSKGLGCPVGSVLCGDAEFIDRARRVRKMLGGGMRQAGVLAAAGLYALDHHIDRLADDHRRAHTLAQGLADVPGVTPDTLTPPTNMVYFGVMESADRFCQRLRHEHNVLCNPVSDFRIRLVTHLDVDDEDIANALSAIRAVAATL